MATTSEFSARLVPPIRNEPPAHRHQIGSVAGGRPYDVDRIGRRNVVVGLEVPADAGHTAVNVAPRVALGEVSAHGGTYRLAVGIVPPIKAGVS